jgi:signal transduction histidine kinase
MRFFGWISGSVIFIVVLFTALTLQTLQSSLRNIQTIERGQTAWVVSRIEFEYIRLNRAIPEFMLGLAKADDVRQRFDILWSRVNVVTTGATAARLAELNLDTSAVTRLRNILLETNAAVETLEDGDLQSAIALRDASAVLNSDIRELTLNVRKASSDQALRTRQSLVRISLLANLMALLTGLTLIITIFLIAMDSRHNRKISEGNVLLLIASNASAEAKTQFISVVNHELRTPLTSISGALSLIRGGAAGEINQKVSQLLEIASRNCDTLTALIGDLLEIDKAQAGKLALTMSVTNVTELVCNSIVANLAYAEKHGIRLVQLPNEQDCYAQVDGVRIMQVIANLLSNAIKFSEAGSEVQVSIHSEVDRLFIVVRDEGIGIPEASLDTIFERFHQVDGKTDRKVGGTGLGLSIARGIVESHGGSLTVSSELGSGSSFTVQLVKAYPALSDN